MSPAKLLGPSETSTATRHLGLSLSDLAEAASALDDTLPKISRDHIYRCGARVTPRLPQLAERDMALGADGRTCTVEVPSSRVKPTVIELDFPSYWIGPVWVQFLASENVGTADTQNPGDSRDNRARLIWRPWHILARSTSKKVGGWRRPRGRPGAGSRTARSVWRRRERDHIRILVEIPERPVAGTITERFPTPAEVTRSFLAEAYTEIGLAAGHIEQLTGQPAERVLQMLHEHGVPIRQPGSQSPWLQRQRDS